MAGFAYHQYVDYSNPTTPRVYAWEVASSASTSEHDPTLQLQDVSPPHHQPQQLQPQISPSQLHLQQLPPPLPPHHLQQVHQQPSPPPQEPPQSQFSVQGHYAPRQPQPQLQTIQVRPAAVSTQPQYRFETITEEDFVPGPTGGSSRRRASSKPPLQVDTSASTSTRQGSSSVPAGSPAALSAGAGPAAHPYRRPQSVDAGAGPAHVRARRVSDQGQPSGAQTPGGAVGGDGTAVVPPTVGTSMGAPCPAADAWREGLLGLQAAAAAAGMDTSFSMEGASLVSSTRQLGARRYAIRADVHYSAEEGVMTAMLELPGVKRGDLRVTLSVCPFSRVRQVSIAGTARSLLPSTGHGVRERKFGEFFRTLAVPPETKPEDVAVSLEDGILTLKIPCGAPAAPEAPQEIAVL
ncbi:uncharacterized protein BXZ73DRAFT_75108 [Epithele typhae]|uniref:uncharacterized protein n=1 Tax=Epithele typhae TaxID=378194 RepID=UPI0020086B7E|nr:uncharacterized protein BXZ73DRAFT_75108 [Epithele typhae]KAH9941139.1 hypothetical protein BXZ73DRAFT_75108 [Epithele typhae]